MVLMVRIGEVIPRQGAGFSQHARSLKNFGVKIEPVFDKLDQKLFDGSLWAKGLLPTLITKFFRFTSFWGIWHRVGLIHCYFLELRFLPAEHYL